MKLLVDKSLFTNENHLLMTREGYQWVSNANVDHDLYLDINESNTLNDYLKMYGIKPMIFIEDKYKKMISTVKAVDPNWKQILPSNVYSKKINDLNVFLKLAKKQIHDGYSEKFLEGNFILKNLEEFVPNEKVLNLKIENPTVRKTIQSFYPEKNGMTKRVLYNRLKTVTGRLVVNKGPQVLLLPRDMKNIFQSRYEDGKILWIDFVSLEPRFAKLLNSDSTKKDIYTDIMEKYKLSCDRKKVKAAVLSTLFGAGLSKLTEIVGKEAFIIKKAIDEYFDLDKILETIGKYDSGKIKNYFGRPISLKKATSNIAINNFIQSSCVDISLIGFSKLIKDSRMPKSVRPLCVIHDAFVLDVRNSDIDATYEIINEGINIDNVGHFFLECNIT